MTQFYTTMAIAHFLIAAVLLLSTHGVEYKEGAKLIVIFLITMAIAGVFLGLASA